MKKIMLLCILVSSGWCITVSSRTEMLEVCSMEKSIERLAVIGHETMFTMQLLAVAKKRFKEVFFIPMREHLPKGDLIPIVPKGVIVFRGADKWDRLLALKPQGMITFQMSFAQKITALAECDRPEVIILSSKTALNQYESNSAATLKALSGTKVISFGHSRLKYIDSFHGVGRSIVKVFRAIPINKEKRVLLLGYGETGKGIAHYLRQEGYSVVVFDTDPVKRVIAVHDRFPIGSFRDLAKSADVVIDATGNPNNIITPITADCFEKPQVYIISTSTNSENIIISDGYKNTHGTLFTVDYSHGMANMYHKVGGSDDEAMRVTGYSLLYMMEHYPAILKELVPINEYLMRASPILEAEIAEAFLKEPQILGGPPLPKL